MIGPIVERFHDLRKSSAANHVFGKRTWAKVTGICLHQTACNLGERPERWRTLGAHIGVTRGGQAIWLHDFTKLVVHGNGWNNQTIGIELDGLYEGVQGDPRTLWDDPTTPWKEQGQTPTPELIASAQAVVRWCCRVVGANGGRISALVAHRQSSATRRNDPGSAIWQAVALPLMDELGLSDGGDGFKIGNGYAIPSSWDKRRTAKY